MEIVFPLFAENKFSFNETNIGFIFTFIGLTVGFTQGVLVGKFVKKFGEIKTVYIAHFLMIFAYILLTIVPNVPLLVLVSGLLAIGIALNEPSLIALISRFGKKSQGVILGSTWSFDSFARMIGPGIAGFLFATVSKQLPFYVNATVLLVSFLILKMYLDRKNIQSL